MGHQPSLTDLPNEILRIIINQALPPRFRRYYYWIPDHKSRTDFRATAQIGATCRLFRQIVLERLYETCEVTFITNKYVKRGTPLKISPFEKNNLDSSLRPNIKTLQAYLARRDLVKYLNIQTIFDDDSQLECDNICSQLALLPSHFTNLRSLSLWAWEFCPVSLIDNSLAGVKLALQNCLGLEFLQLGFSYKVPKDSEIPMQGTSIEQLNFGTYAHIKRLRIMLQQASTIISDYFWALEILRQALGGISQTVEVLNIRLRVEGYPGSNELDLTIQPWHFPRLKRLILNYGAGSDFLLSRQISVDAEKLEELSLKDFSCEVSGEVTGQGFGFLPKFKNLRTLSFAYEIHMQWLDFLVDNKSYFWNLKEIDYKFSYPDSRMEAEEILERYGNRLKISISSIDADLQPEDPRLRDGGVLTLEL